MSRIFGMLKGRTRLGRGFFFGPFYPAEEIV